MQYLNLGDIQIIPIHQVQNILFTELQTVDSSIPIARVSLQHNSSHEDFWIVNDSLSRLKSVLLWQTVEMPSVFRVAPHDCLTDKKLAEVYSYNPKNKKGNPLSLVPPPQSE